MQSQTTNLVTTVASLLLLVLFLTDHVTSRGVQGNSLVTSSLMRDALPAAPLLPLEAGCGAVQGVHMALEGAQEVRVTWMTPADWSSGPFYPTCYYGAKDVTSYKIKGIPYSYTAGMFNHTLNTAVLDLSEIPCMVSSSAGHCIKAIKYKCGEGRFGFSKVYQAHLFPGTEAPLVPGSMFAIVGDMGVPHGLKTIDSIAARLGPNPKKYNTSDAGGVQMLLHVGDISYADYYDAKSRNNSWMWVDYMNGVEKVAAQVPYLTAPGNHEAQFGFAAYLNWLPMPHNASGSDSPFWFSVDYLGVHLLFFSTEHDFSPNSTQHRWMQQDLKRANENRAQVPWVVVLGHRPLYCSSLVGYERCHQEGPLYRTYVEDLFYESHVDAVIAGHIHHYERSYPVYQGKTTQRHYHDPRAPVYIVNGGAGNPEPNDPTFEPNVGWRAWYNATVKTGFLLMTPSRFQLSFDYVFSDSNDVVDSFTITKK